VGVALLVGGALYSLQSKISAATTTPSAGLKSEPFVLRPIEIESRVIDLGFSRFSIPKAVPGDPFQVNDTLFVNLNSESQRPSLTICAPFSDRDATVQDLLDQLKILLGIPSISWFEAQKRTLEIQPFNIFGVLAKGYKASVRDLTLLAVKNLSFGSARDTVKVFENETTGAFIYKAEIGDFIEVHDKKAGLSQLFIVPPQTGDVNVIASAIIKTYRAESGDLTEAGLLKRLSATGISKTTPRTESTTDTHKVRFDQVAEEVRNRRIERSK